MYQRLLGHPFVYDVIRPLVVGGLDTATLFAPVGLRPDDVVFDVGCGTGVALEHLPRVAHYLGFDIDAVAIARARERALRRAEPVTLYDRAVTRQDVEREAPSVALLVGVLHHLSDDAAVQLLETLGQSPRLRLIYSLDVAFFEGRRINNLLARLDRGHFVRTPSGYAELVARADLSLDDTGVVGVRGAQSVVRYHTMAMQPRRVDGS